MTKDEKIEYHDKYWGFIKDLYDLCQAHHLEISDMKGDETMACSHIISGLERLKTEYNYRYFRYNRTDELLEKVEEDWEDWEDRDTSINLDRFHSRR